MTLPLFDNPMQKGAGPAGRPVDAGDAHSSIRASSDHAVEPPPQEASGSDANDVRRAGGSEIPPFSDVLRQIEHKRGPFRWLVDTDAAHPREHRIVQLVDGSYHAQMIDNGQRVPLDWPVDAIEAILKRGIWVEVR